MTPPRQTTRPAVIAGILLIAVPIAFNAAFAALAARFKLSEHPPPTHR